uniref:Uncharacterized protein n=1 Tax=Timema genevievae TaxID=629358 RepID=A0A7R9JQK4_TIMGE|nr:unnamed protein product [Timema genevievae]
MKRGKEGGRVSCSLLRCPAARIRDTGISRDSGAVRAHLTSLLPVYRPLIYRDRHIICHVRRFLPCNIEPIPSPLTSAELRKEVVPGVGRSSHGVLLTPEEAVMALFLQPASGRNESSGVKHDQLPGTRDLPKEDFV